MAEGSSTQPRNSGVFAVVMVIALALLWLVLSGRDEILILSLGGVTVFIAMFMSARMGLFDVEGAPYGRMPRLLLYWLWLGGEIAKSNLVVARIVVKPEIDITPRLMRIPANATSDFARTIFANSITLTPGTVTVDVNGDELVVHALSDALADPAAFEEMRERSNAASEGPRA